MYQSRPTKSVLRSYETEILGRIDAVTSSPRYDVLEHAELDKLIAYYRDALRYYHSWAKGKAESTQYRAPKKVWDAISKYQNP